MLIHRGRGTEFVLLQLLGDFLAVVLGLAGAYWLRFHSGVIPPAGGWDPALYRAQIPWAVGLWLLALHLTHNYQNHPNVISFNRARRLLIGSLLAVALIVARNYFWRVWDTARLLYPIALVLTLVLLVVGRLILQRLIVAFFLGNSLPRARVLIVGLGPTAIRLAARLRIRPEYAYELIGFVSSDAASVGRRIGGAPVLGTVGDLRRILRAHSIHDVFIAQGEFAEDALFRLFLESEMETARVHVIPTPIEMMRTTVYYDEIAGVPIYRIRETPLQGANLLAKRLFDVAVSFTALAVLSPLLLAVAWLVRRSSPGPAIYAQKRLSLDGREFTIYKFRTMPIGSEREGPAWGTQNDPRATRLGAFLRRWNIDELPQLWNVLRGEMSLVGPRPERPHFADQFREAIPSYMARHRVPTGITGWAQVHGLRGDTSISQRLRYDLYYIENWSMWLDIKVLLMTFFRPRARARRPRIHNQPAALTNQENPACPSTQTPGPSTEESRGSRAPAAG